MFIHSLTINGTVKTVATNNRNLCTKVWNGKLNSLRVTNLPKISDISEFQGSLVNNLIMVPSCPEKKSVPRNKCLPLYSLFLDSCFLLIKPIFQLPPTIALSPEIFVFLSDALVRNPKGDETLRFAPRPKKPKF